MPHALNAGNTDDRNMKQFDPNSFMTRESPRRARQSSVSDPRTPTVTVLIATYNRAALIGQTLDSLLNQSRPPDAITVINDGSTDNTHAIVQAYGAAVQYLEQANAGKSAALNRALEHVETDYVWVFDDDDIALPAALAAHLACLTKNPECNLTYSSYYSFQDGQQSIPASWRLQQLPKIAPEDFFLWIVTSLFLPASMLGMLIATRCFRCAGEFDETLRRSQDLDMIIRIARNGRPCFVDQPTWALRDHQGVRGSASHLHQAADRYAVWRQYDHEIFVKLRNTLPLEGYLPGAALPSHARTLDASGLQRAVLQRAVIMATHGLFNEAADDFAAYVEKRAEQSEASDEPDGRRISSLSHVHSAELAPPAYYYRRLGKIARRDRGLIRPLARGLYWSMRRDISARPLLAARCMLRVSALLSGFAGRREA